MVARERSREAESRRAAECRRSVESSRFADAACALLARCLVKWLERSGVPRRRLHRVCGVSRETLRKMQRGEKLPCLHVTLRMLHGMGMPLSKVLEKLLRVVRYLERQRK